MHPSKESCVFLQKLLQKPPSLPFDPTLFPMLFAATWEDSTASINELVTLIERSQNLASRVLTLANSAIYGLEFKVSTLHQAIRVLGFRAIRMLAVTAGMAAITRETKLPKDFPLTAWWRHQLTTASIAKTLAEELGAPSGPCGPFAAEENRLDMVPDEAYVAGLLHDVGKIFFASICSDHWTAVEERWQQSGQPYYKVENAYWGIDHALIGATILHHWKLPLLLTESINWHHGPELAAIYKMGARLLAAANYIAYSDFETGCRLCEEAVALLPEGIDSVALGAAIAKNLAGSGSRALVKLL